MCVKGGGVRWVFVNHIYHTYPGMCLKPSLLFDVQGLSPTIATVRGTWMEYLLGLSYNR